MNDLPSQPAQSQPVEPPAVEPVVEPVVQPAVAPAAVEAQPQPADMSPAQCAARLAELFPALFARGVNKPLKLGTANEIRQRCPSMFSKRLLSIVLQRHTTQTPYLKALVNGKERFDLDGAPAGEIADEHRQAAVVELERRRAMHQERGRAQADAARKAEAEESRRAAHESRQAAEATRRAEYEQRETEGKGRAERAAVLRAFEASSLSRANFCTLMRIADAELDAVLAQARLDRQANSPKPGPNHGPNPGPNPGRQKPG